MTIRHSNGSYDVLFESLSAALSTLPQDSFIFTDHNVKEAWGHLFPASSPYHSFEPGEKSKSIKQFEVGLEWLAKMGASRKSVVVAVGGGVVGDLAGFIASAYMRGVALVQIPTSLLAMVDSSVGGKVGVDLDHGKNLAGAFYPPSKVSICIEALSTLPEREFRNGMAEVWKYAYILDEGLLPVLRSGVGVESPTLQGVVKRCIELKRDVVSEDEFETTGYRAILNFGHTIGHSIEHAAGYGNLLHGEAISIGMVLEARLGERLGITPAGASSKIQADLDFQKLPTTLPGALSADQLLAVMARDKKAHSGCLAFSLLTGIGACKLICDVPSEDVQQVLEGR